MKRIYVKEEWCLGSIYANIICAFANSGKPDMTEALKRKTESFLVSILKKAKKSVTPFPADTVPIHYA